MEIGKIKPSLHSKGSLFEIGRFHKKMLKTYKAGRRIRTLPGGTDHVIIHPTVGVPGGLARCHGDQVNPLLLKSGRVHAP